MGKKPAPRKRARDEGSVTPLGAEISTRVYNLMERCRTAKRWTKRSFIEEAITRYGAEEGFSLDDAEEEG